ncbi:hypothetical protein [Deinococcus sp.]|uniref:hypothetical protein n=1 Tax=Deinococcus sp. TaxID=47478 RepID=UPI003C799EAF
MQLYAHVTQEQLSDHLHALRQEAAQARMVSSRPGLLAGFLGVLKRQARAGQPSAASTVSKPGVHIR